MAAIVKGSLGAIAQHKGQSLAESFLDVDAVVLIDTSGSMDAADAQDGHSRYEMACKELDTLQAKMPGKIAVIAFSGSGQVEFCPNGKPTSFKGRTDVAGALKFAKKLDVSGMHFILISDGEPDEPAATLTIARTYTNRIDTIFIGDERYPAGRDFLRQLSAASGGTSLIAARVQELAINVQRLLSSKLSTCT